MFGRLITANMLGLKVTEIHMYEVLLHMYAFAMLGNSELSQSRVLLFLNSGLYLLLCSTEDLLDGLDSCPVLCHSISAATWSPEFLV